MQAAATANDYLAEARKRRERRKALLGGVPAGYLTEQKGGDHVGSGAGSSPGQLVPPSPELSYAAHADLDRSSQSRSFNARALLVNEEDHPSLARNPAYHLDHGARSQREHDAELHAIKQMMHSKRKLHGHTIADSRAVFAAIDRDHSGTLDLAEFGEAMNRLGLGLNKQQMDSLVQSMNRDGDGSADYAELLSFLHGEEAENQQMSAQHEEDTWKQRDATRRHVSTASWQREAASIALAEQMQREDETEARVRQQRGRWSDYEELEDNSHNLDKQRLARRWMRTPHIGGHPGPESGGEAGAPIHSIRVDEVGPGEESVRLEGAFNQLEGVSTMRLRLFGQEKV